MVIEIQDISCPCTLHIMCDPVSTSDGFTFEREFIEEWFKTKTTNPTTNTTLTNKNLLPNRTIKSIIDNYLMNNQHHFDNDEVYQSKSLIEEVRKNISDDDLNKLNFQLSTFIDYRYFTQDLGLQNGYSAFHLAAERSSIQLLTRVFDYLYENKHLTKLKPPPIGWQPRGLIKLIDNCLNVNPFRDKVDQLLVFHQHIKNLDSFYLHDLIVGNSKKNFDIVEYLMGKNLIDVNNQRPTDGNTLLMNAVLTNDPKLINFLLTKQSADCDLVNKDGENAYFISLKTKNTGIKDLLVEHLTVQKNLNRSALERAKNCALHKTILLYSTNLNLIEKVINLESSYLEHEDSNGETALILACKIGTRPVIELLLKYGANVNHLDKLDRNCLHYAVEATDDKRLLSLLISNQVNVHHIDLKNKSPLDLTNDRNLKNFLLNEFNTRASKQFQNLQNRIVELEAKNKKLEDEVNHLKMIFNQGASYQPKGQMLASAHEDGTIKLWNIDQAMCVKLVQVDKPSKINLLEFIPDQSCMISYSDDGKISKWDLSTFSCIKSFVLSNQVLILKQFDKSKLACGCNDNSIKIVDVEKFTQVDSLVEHISPIICFEVYNVKHLISGSENGSIFKWDIQCKKPEFKILGKNLKHMKLIDGRELFSIAEDKIIRVWSMENGSSLNKIDLNKANLVTKTPFICRIIMINNERELLLLVNHNLVYLNSNTFKVRVLNIKDEDFSGDYELWPDKKTLVTCSFNKKTIKVWDLTNGSQSKIEHPSDFNFIKYFFS